MLGRPQPGEAASYYFTYINQVAGDDVVGVIERQLDETVAFLAQISEERSLHRYAAGKWSIRQVLNHLSDAERIFVYRALWFARGFPDPLASFDQDVAVASAGADAVAWAAHIAEFRSVRLATIALFRNLPADAWMKTGTASGNRFTVRALAYIVAGHVTHHVKILRERYF